MKVGHIDVVALTRDRDALFAEAVLRYRAGAQWWPDPNFERLHIQPEQEARLERDAWEDPVKIYLQNETRVTIGEVARHALGFVDARLGTADQRRIARVLKVLGWVNVRDRNGRWYVRGVAHDAV